MLHTLRRGLTTASPLRAFSALPWSLPPSKPEPCSVHQALEDVRGGKLAKFDETIDIAVGLGVDPRKASQNIRGTIELPHGTGKKIRVAVFAEGEDAESALQAGRHTHTYPRLLRARSRPGTAGILIPQHRRFRLDAASLLFPSTTPILHPVPFLSSPTSTSTIPATLCTTARPPHQPP